jgi:uncharacterized lipoprotein
MTVSRYLVALTVLVLPLGGCKLLRTDCHKPEPYQKATSGPPLKVPPGLDAPDTKAALRIPELHDTPPPRGPKEPCLDAPPKYTPPPAPVHKPPS